MDIHILTYDRSDQIQLPVVPEEIPLTYESDSIIYNTIRQGDINLPGLDRLASCTIESFFPVDERPYSKNKSMFGWSFVEKLQAWRRDRIPVRLIFTDPQINELMTIQKISTTVRRGNGDIYYSLELVGFKEIELNKPK